MPAAPSTDRQLKPQGNMVSPWGPGRSEHRGRESRGVGSAQCSPVLYGKVLGLGGQDQEL